MWESEVRKTIERRGSDFERRLHRLQENGNKKEAIIRRLARSWCRGLPMAPQQLHSFESRTLEDCGGLQRYEREDDNDTAEEDGKAGSRPQTTDDNRAAAESGAAADGDDDEQEDERQLRPLNNNNNNGKAS